MAAGDWVYWLAWGVVLIVYAAMIYLAWRALFQDRANGRRRCPRCWYDLAYSPGMTCAECGFTARHEGQLEKTRRYYGRAAVAILACVAIAGVVHHQVSLQGWTSLVPTKALILTLPLSTSERGPIHAELNRRMNADVLSEREWLMTVRRCVKGDWWARPPDDAWARKYGVMIDRWRGSFARRRIRAAQEHEGQIATQQNAPFLEIERLMLDIPPLLDLETRERWPADVTPSVQVWLRHWWPAGTETRLRIQSAADDAADGGELAAMLYRNTRGGMWASLAGLLDSREPGGDQLVLDVVVERRHAADAAVDSAWTPVVERRFVLPMQVASSIEEILEPLDDDEMLNQAMREVFRGMVVRWPAGRSPVRFRYDPRPLESAAAGDVAVGVHVELRRGDKLARRLNIWWNADTAASSRWGGQGRNLGWEVAFEDLDLLAELDADDDRWRMHMSGSGEIALRAGEATRFWAGSFTAPVVVTDRRGAAPAPAWWVEYPTREPAPSD